MVTGQAVYGGRTATARRRCRVLPRGRTLHLLDLENLTGDPFAAAPEVRTAITRYQHSMRVRDFDHVVVACNRWLALEAGLAWPGIRLLPAAGRDGADRALIDAADPQFVATHYDRVVIGSGDGIFARLAMDLRHFGTAVCVVARPGTISADLHRAAGVTLRLAAS